MDIKNFFSLFKPKNINETNGEKINIKNFFSLEEWRTLQFAPMWVYFLLTGPITIKYLTIAKKVLDEERKIILEKILGKQVEKKYREAPEANAGWKPSGKNIWFAFWLNFKKRGIEISPTEDVLELEYRLMEEGWSLLDIVICTLSYRGSMRFSGWQQVEEWMTKDSRGELEGLRDVADLLDKKAIPEHTSEFKEFIMRIGKRITEELGPGFVPEETLDRALAALRV